MLAITKFGSNLVQQYPDAKDKELYLIGHGSVPEVTLAVTKVSIFRQAYTGQGASQSVSIACYNGNVSAALSRTKILSPFFKDVDDDNRRECITCPLFSNVGEAQKRDFGTELLCGTAVELEGILIRDGASYDGLDAKIRLAKFDGMQAFQAIKSSISQMQRLLALGKKVSSNLVVRISMVTKKSTAKNPVAFNGVALQVITEAMPSVALLQAGGLLQPTVFSDLINKNEYVLGLTSQYALPANVLTTVQATVPQALPSAQPSVTDTTVPVVDLAHPF